MTRRTTRAIQLLALLTAAAVTAFAAGDTAIAGRSVAATLVRADDLSAQSWPDASFRLITSTVKVPANETIYDLLTANGVEPDVEAFTLVYDLNLALKRVDPLPAGDDFVLPQVAGSDQLRQKLHQGYLVMLTVDPVIREELGKSAVEIADLSARIAQIPVERFPDPLSKETATKQVRALAGWFAYTQRSFSQRTGPALRRQTLLGMHDEAEALSSLLASLLAGQGALTLEDLNQLGSIYKDMQSLIKKYDNIMAGEPQRGDDQYEVIVNVQGKDAQLIKTLQVYYTLEGLYRKPPREPLKSYPFDQLGSGVSAKLSLQDYVIWAAKPGRPFPSFTEPHPVSIQAAQASPRYLDLSLLP
jgi:hypothetical protein